MPNKQQNCKICGAVFYRSGRGRWALCSEACKRKNNTAMHRRYVENNRARVNESARRWKIRNWGASDAEIAKRAEQLAFERILPKLGFTDIYDVTAVRRYVPFDFVATNPDGERVLIDVTTGMTKSGHYHRSGVSLVNALRMRLYVLFVKPDLSSYSLRDSTKGFHMSVKELVPIG